MVKSGASEGYLKMSATDVYEQPVPVKREMTYIPSAYFLKTPLVKFTLQVLAINQWVYHN